MIVIMVEKLNSITLFYYRIFGFVTLSMRDGAICCRRHIWLLLFFIMLMSRPTGICETLFYTNCVIVSKVKLHTPYPKYVTSDRMILCYSCFRASAYIGLHWWSIPYRFNLLDWLPTNLMASHFKWIIAEEMLHFKSWLLVLLWSILFSCQSTQFQNF